MRFSAMVAGAALLVAACGGSKGGAEPKAEAPSTAATTPAAGGTGNTVTVEMVSTSATSFKFVPENITIKAGDVVVFKGVSGLAHNVAFWGDSIPPGAAAVLTAAMKGGTGDMATEMINDGSSVSISFAGAPAGKYGFYCIPHLAMGMKGTLTVQ